MPSAAVHTAATGLAATVKLSATRVGQLVSLLTNHLPSTFYCTQPIICMTHVGHQSSKSVSSVSVSTEKGSVPALGNRHYSLATTSPGAINRCKVDHFVLAVLGFVFSPNSAVSVNFQGPQLHSCRTLSHPSAQQGTQRSCSLDYQRTSLSSLRLRLASVLGQLIGSTACTRRRPVGR